MRAAARISLFSLLSLAACSGDDGGTTTFNDEGGTLMVPNCNYSITTRLGAEAPKASGSKVGANPAPRLVHLGLVGDPMTSVVAQWRTMDDETTAGSLRYGVGANLPEAQLTTEVKGIQFGYRSTGTDIYRMHQAHVCGLQPGTTYSYQVGTGSTWSPVYTFHTAPDIVAHPDAESVYAFVGDSRGGYDVWMQVAAQIQSRSPDLVLFSGDAVTIGLTQPEWEEFQAGAESLFATTPVVLTNGNHEANAINYYSQFAMPGDQQNFGFSYGFSRIFVANDEPENPSDVTGTIAQAIDADFTANESARWKMMMHHRPMYSSGTRHGSATDLQQAWGAIVDKHHLDLVLNGHEHQYEISKPLAANAVVSSNAAGTVYVVAGGAGAELYGFGTPGFWSDYIESTHTAAIIHARRDQLTLDSFRDDGTAIPNSFVKTKL